MAVGHCCDDLLGRGIARHQRRASAKKTKQIARLGGLTRLKCKKTLNIAYYDMISKDIRRSMMVRL